MNVSETIVAQVTCPGKSAVGILRVSGPQSDQVAIQVLGKIPRSRFATYSRFLDENMQVLDRGIALWFPAPFSLTGENVLELQGHGSPLVMDLLMKRILSIKNIRVAKPGEFSERAFLNGKIDLIQAEAIDDLINSETELSVRASLNSLQGDFSFYIHELINTIIEFRIYIESNIDFSEEEISIDLENFINLKFEELENKFIKIKTTAVKGSLLREERKIVIFGLPNSGKSSLLNVLSCSERAIVTDIPGTTRDLLYEDININGISYKFVDTAGFRDTDNTVEKIGITRSLKAVKESDHIIFIIDKTTSESDQKKIYDEFIKYITDNTNVTFVLNKNDLVQHHCYIKEFKDLKFFKISTYTGEGIDVLCNHITKTERNLKKEGVFIARRRHIHQIELAFNEFLYAKKNWVFLNNIEILAESLSIINNFLGEITGRFTSDNLLEKIFSKFCIGK